MKTIRLSKKQRQDVESVKYFIPTTVDFDPVTDADVQTYLDWSDRGIGKKEIEQEAMQKTTGLAAMYWGKNRRDLQISSYLEDWGSTCTAMDFVEEPREVVEFIARAMKKPGILHCWDMFNEKETG